MKSSKKSLPWYETTNLWAQINLTEIDPVSSDVEIWKNYWKKAGVEGAIINCGGIVTYYRTKYSYQYKAKYLGDRDYFAVWNDAARDCGLTVIARMDINATSRELFDQYPEWYCRDSEGLPLLSRGRFVTCVNGGYYREFIPKVLEEIILTYHPDGFVDNGWTGNSADTICYCGNCRRLFREYSGSSLPERADYSDPVYRTWLKWSYARRVEIARYFNSITRRFGGDACLWCGMVNGDPFRSSGRFYDYRNLLEDAPVVFCDQQVREHGYSNAANVLFGRLLYLLGGEKALIPESMAHYYRGYKTFRVSSALKQEVRNWMGAGLSGGFVPWMHIVGANTIDPRKLSLTDDIYRRIKASPGLLHRGLREAGDVGLLWNQETAVYHGRNKGESKPSRAFRAAAEMLMEEGISFLPIHTDQLELYMDRVRCLVLPDVAILREETEELLVRWLKEGKSLILTDDSALRDSSGEWRGPGRLFSFLGLDAADRLSGATEQDPNDWAFPGTHNYLYLCKNDTLNLEEDIGAELVPFGGAVRDSSSSGPLKPVLRLVPAFPIFPPEFSYIREVSKTACAYAGELPGGARAVYIPAELDCCFGADRIPDLRKVFVRLVSWALKDRFRVRLTAPAAGQVLMTAWQKENRLVLHLVNVAGSNVPPGTFEHYLPAGPLTLEFDAPVRLSSVSSLTSDEDMKERILVSGNMLSIRSMDEDMIIEVR